MKIVLASKNKGPETEELLASAQKRLIECEQVDVVDIEQEIDADALYWRSGSVLSRYPGQTGRTIFLKRMARKIPIVNKVMAKAPYTVEKNYQQYLALQKKKLLNPIPTFVARNEKGIHELIENGKLVYPFIAKPNVGSQGKGVVLVESEADIAKIENIRDRIYQNFIKNDGDYRIFVIGGVAVDVVKREPTKDSTQWFLNNLCQGGKPVAVPRGELYEKLVSMGEGAAILFELTVCGVDVIKDADTGQLHFMEINTVPQWVSFKSALETDVADEIIDTLVSLAQSRKEGLVPEDVRAYYDKRVGYLPIRKQFHYLSRMYLWTRDAVYKKTLEDLKPKWDEGVEKLCREVASIPTSVPEAKRSGGRAYRKPWYKEHYKVYKYNKVFFSLLFLQTVYEDDSYKKVLEAIDKDDIRKVWDTLRNDSSAILGLSTHAINFQYHVANFFGEPYHVDVKDLLAWIRQDLKLDPEGLSESKLYLITHAIIGASCFYSRDIKEKESFFPLLEEAERILQDTMMDISLDVKFEFLVCCRLLGYASVLEKGIWNEATRSSSPHGNYYVDTYNIFGGRQYLESLALSEHRNVLGIMAATSKKSYK